MQNFDENYSKSGVETYRLYPESAFQFDYDPEWTNQKRVFPSPPIGRLASGS